MDLKYCQIDPTKVSKDVLRTEIERLDKLRTFYENLNNGIKIFLNSCYGAVGNEHFIGYNPDVAEAVTLQGQNLIKFSIKIINKYLSEIFPTLTGLHKKLKIKLKDSFISVKESPIVYSDTDSCYVTFDVLLKHFDTSYYGGNLTKLMLGIVKLDLARYLTEQFDAYADHFGTQNLQDFELEGISYTGLFLEAKKKYILDIAWKEGGDDGIFYDKGTYYKYTGVEIVRSSTPIFVRDRLKNITKYLVDNSDKVTITELINKVKTIRSEFLLDDIQNISQMMGITDYDKYVLNDRETLVLGSGCPLHVRAAAVHNHLINKNPKLKKKYRLIKKGDKIKYFYSDSNRTMFDVFAFLPGEFPKELNILPDYKKQFSKTFMEPLNRFVSVVLKETIPENLVTMKRLF